MLAIVCVYTTIYELLIDYMLDKGDCNFTETSPILSIKKLIIHMYTILLQLALVTYNCKTPYLDHDMPHWMSIR